MVQESLINKEYSDGIKGWMCIGVLLHHLSLFSGIFANTYFGHFLNILGTWTVAVFLFLSGYGLYYSYSVKGSSYIKGFLKGRFLPLYISYLIIVVMYFFYDFHREMTLIKVLKSLTWGGTIVSFGWFFQLLFVMYLVFFSVFRFCKNKYLKSGILGMVFLIYVLFAHCFGQYDVPVISFATGMIAAVHKEKLNQFFHKNYPWLMGVCFCIFFTVYMINVYGAIMGKFELSYFAWSALAVLSDLGIIGFVICACIVCEKFRIPIIVNPIMLTVKKFSFEIYVLQGMVIRFFYTYFENRVLYFFVAGITVILASVPFHYFIAWIIKMVKGPRKLSL